MRKISEFECEKYANRLGNEELIKAIASDIIECVMEDHDVPVRFDSRWELKNALGAVVRCSTKTYSFPYENKLQFQPPIFLPNTDIMRQVLFDDWSSLLLSEIEVLISRHRAGIRGFYVGAAFNVFKIDTKQTAEEARLVTTLSYQIIPFILDKSNKAHTVEVIPQ